MEDQNQNHTPPVSPITQTPPIQTPSGLDSKKPKSKLPILIIGIILFLLLAGSAAGFYVLKQQSSKTAKLTLAPSPAEVSTKVGTPDPTASWKTYEGKGFSFKYHPDYEISKRAYGEVDFHSKDGFGATILKSQNTPFPEPKAKENSSGNDGTTVAKESITLAGKKAFRYTQTNTQTELLIIQYLFFDVDGTYYEVNSHVDGGGAGFIGWLISTFKFE